jgi:hypothetical protein
MVRDHGFRIQGGVTLGASLLQLVRKAKKTEEEVDRPSEIVFEILVDRSPDGIPSRLE